MPDPSPIPTRAAPPAAARPPHGGYPGVLPDAHRCYGCGSDDPMVCGTLCADCSWDEHCYSIAGIDPQFDPPDPRTPECCRRSRLASERRFADELRRTVS